MTVTFDNSSEVSDSGPGTSRFVTADDILVMARKGEKLVLSRGVKLTDLARELAVREGVLVPDHGPVGRPFLVAGNWKMNCDLPQTIELVNSIIKGFSVLADSAAGSDLPGEVALCPPFISLAIVARMLNGTGIVTGAQNLSEKPSGAFTGEVSASMISSCGASMVIVGHSERRTLYGEADVTVNAKAISAQAGGLRPIVCVGETLMEKENQKTLSVIRRQVRECLKGLDAVGLAVAYEPVWAIGTGKAAKPAEAAMVHSFIRDILMELFGPKGGKVPILYGGSVNAANSADFFADREIDGALVGGASLKASDFCEIIASCFSARR